MKNANKTVVMVHKAFPAVVNEISDDLKIVHSHDGEIETMTKGDFVHFRLSPVNTVESVKETLRLRFALRRPIRDGHEFPEKGVASKLAYQLAFNPETNIIASC